MINILSSNKIFSTGIVLLFLSVLFVGASRAQSEENPLIYVGKTKSGLQRIFIKANGVSLPDLLEKVKSQSGIDFKINGGLLEESISVDIEATTWTEAVQEVLKDYNRVELWGRNRQLAGVYVVDTLNPGGPYFAEPSLEGENRNTKQFARDNRPIMDEEIALSKGQLVKLVQGRYRSPISPQLWEDEQLRSFLEQHGINNPEDLNDLKKAMTIRQAARRQLRDLRKNRPAR